MTARILPLDSDEHRRAQELLPWWVNGTLDDLEAGQMREHLARCNVCREGAVALEELSNIALPASTREHVERGWAALRSRLDAPSHASAGVAAKPREWRLGLGAALATQAAVIVALGLALALSWQRPAPEPYRALGTVAASQANAIAIFRADATQAQMSSALRIAQARIVGGPTTTDAYLLRLPDADPAALDRLRALPGVLDVQSLQPPAP